MSIKAIESKYLNSRNADLLVQKSRYAFYIRKVDGHLCHILKDQKKYKDLGKTTHFHLNEDKGQFTYVTNVEDSKIRHVVVVDAMTLKEEQRIPVSKHIPIRINLDAFLTFSEDFQYLQFYCENKNYDVITVPLSESLSLELNKNHMEGTDSCDNPKSPFIVWIGPYLKKLVIITTTSSPDYKNTAHYYQYDRDFGRVGLLAVDSVDDGGANIQNFFQGRYNPITKKTYPPRVENKQRETQPA